MPAFFDQVTERAKSAINLLLISPGIGDLIDNTNGIRAVDKYLLRGTGTRRVQLWEPCLEVLFQGLGHDVVGDAAARTICKGEAAVDLAMTRIEKTAGHSQLGAEAIDWQSACLQELQGRDLSFKTQTIKVVFITILIV